MLGFSGTLTPKSSCPGSLVHLCGASVLESSWVFPYLSTGVIKVHAPRRQCFDDLSGGFKK